MCIFVFSFHFSLTLIKDREAAHQSGFGSSVTLQRRHPQEHRFKLATPDPSIAGQKRPIFNDIVRERQELSRTAHKPLYTEAITTAPPAPRPTQAAWNAPVSSNSSLSAGAASSKRAKPDHRVAAASSPLGSSTWVASKTQQASNMSKGFRAPRPAQAAPVVVDDDDELLENFDMEGFEAEHEARVSSQPLSQYPPSAKSYQQQVPSSMPAPPPVTRPLQPANHDSGSKGKGAGQWSAARFVGAFDVENAGIANPPRPSVASGASGGGEEEIHELRRRLWELEDAYRHRNRGREPPPTPRTGASLSVLFATPRGGTQGGGASQPPSSFQHYSQTPQSSQQARPSYPAQPMSQGLNYFLPLIGGVVRQTISVL